VILAMAEAVKTGGTAHEHTALRSGHKVGKSTLDAALALWWVCTRPDARVVFTSSAGHQVENILWPELRKLYQKARAPIGGRLYDDYHKGLKLPDGREVFGITTRDAEAFAGLSGANLLFIVDEASGFPEPIFNSVFGNMAGGGKVVLTGNPTRTSGTFYDSFHAKRDAWKPLHIRSMDNPNFHGGDIPGLANPAWVEWAKKQWGVGTPAWDVRVEGNFPRLGENTVCSLAVVEDAGARWEETRGEGLLHLGVDVGRFGDDPSVIYPRRGQRALTPTELRGLDGPDVAGEVLKVARALRHDDTERPRVKVDVIGVGASVFDVLKRSKEVVAVPIDVSSRAVDPEQYANLRAEAWFTLAAWLSGGGAIPADPDLEGELVAPTYSFDGQGRYVIEPKDKIKARLGRSPDHAEGLMLSVVDATPVSYATAREARAQASKATDRPARLSRRHDRDDS
jgi:hypothetical protein